MKRQLPSQALEEQLLSPASRDGLLSETIRLGTQLMLQKVVELEVTEFLGRAHSQYLHPNRQPEKGLSRRHFRHS